MRKKDINGLINDILGYLGWRNPLSRIFLPRKVEVDLLSKEVLGVDKDDIFKFYHEKINWFHNRIKYLKGELKDFKKAKIEVYGAKEKIKIIYKGSQYSDEVIFKN